MSIFLPKKVIGNMFDHSLNSDPEEISKYTRDIDYLPACNFCNGRSFDAKEIVPAIQTPNRKPLPYKIYS